MNLNDQELVTGEVTKSIAQCRNLKVLDLTGCKGIDEMGMQNMIKGYLPQKDTAEKLTIVGLQQLEQLKLNNLDKIYDSSVVNIMRNCPMLTHLELNKCENMTDFLFEAITVQKVAPKLKYLDINMIKNFKPEPLEEF